MIRTHVSKSDSISVRAVKQRERAGDKPHGFWYEVDGSWRDWCSSEQPDWLEDMHLHEVTLGDERILTVSNLADFAAFSKKYATSSGLHWAREDQYIDWQQVVQEYDGIEIAPYFWERRMDCSWYYSWDVASGVIWRPKGVMVKLIGKVEPVMVDTRD